MKTVQAITVTIPNEIATQLNELQKSEMKNCSSIVTEALRQYIEWKMFKGLQKEAAAVARAMGIRTEEDVVKLIHDFRKSK